MPSGRSGSRAVAVGRALSRGRPPADRLRRAVGACPGSGQHDHLGQAPDGAWHCGHREPRQHVVPHRRGRRWHGPGSDARWREVAGRDQRRDPCDVALSRGRHVRRRAVRRRHHRACVLRRRPAPGDQGCRSARGHQRAATDQRAHCGRDRVWPGQRQRRRLRGVRPGRRHFRHLHPSTDAGRVRGHCHWRRLCARWRRLRPRTGRLRARTVRSSGVE